MSDQAAFRMKVYYNPYINPSTNSFWGVISLTADEIPYQSQPPVISLICDVSGSMKGDKYNMMVSTVEDLILNVPDGIMLQIVVFDDNATEVMPLTHLQPDVKRKTLVNGFRMSIGQATKFRGTAMSTGIMMALKTHASIQTSAARYGIFLSDGQNTEPEQQLAAAVKRAADFKMHLCAYGYGRDWKPDQLTLMAQITQGWMPKAVSNPSDLRHEFLNLVGKMAKTVASDVHLQLWTPTGARIRSLSQAYPEWTQGEAQALDDHLWRIPVPPMSAQDHRDFIVHIELASVGARLVACRPAVIYRAGEQIIEEKGDQNTWIILQQTNDAALFNQINPVVAGYLGQGQLAASTRAMTDALAQGDAHTAERHRTEALEIARAVGNRSMTAVLEEAGAGSEIARKTAALGTSTVSLTEE